MAGLGLIIAFGVRLLPAVVIFVLRGGSAPVWALATAVIFSIALTLVSEFVGYLRGSYYANEYNPEIADPFRVKLRRLAPLWWGAWLTYGLALIALLIA